MTLDPTRLEPELATLGVTSPVWPTPDPPASALLASAGLHTTVSEAHDDALGRMVEQIEARLRALSLLPGAGFDVETILGYTATPARAVVRGVAEYHLIMAERS